MTNEYITKAQAIDLVKSLEVVLGCLGVSVLARELERLEAKGPHLYPEIVLEKLWEETDPYTLRRYKNVMFAADKTYTKEQIEHVLRDMMQAIFLNEEERG